MDTNLITFQRKGTTLRAQVINLIEADWASVPFQKITIGGRQVFCRQITLPIGANTLTSPPDFKAMKCSINFSQMVDPDLVFPFFIFTLPSGQLIQAGSSGYQNKSDSFLSGDIVNFCVPIETVLGSTMKLAMCFASEADEIASVELQMQLELVEYDAPAYWNQAPRNSVPIA